MQLCHQKRAGFGIWRRQDANPRQVHPTILGRDCSIDGLNLRFGSSDNFQHVLATR